MVLIAEVVCLKLHMSQGIWLDPFFPIAGLSLPQVHFRFVCNASNYNAGECGLFPTGGETSDLYPGVVSGSGRKAASIAMRNHRAMPRCTLRMVPSNI